MKSILNSRSGMILLSSMLIQAVFLSPTHAQQPRPPHPRMVGTPPPPQPDQIDDRFAHPEIGDHLSEITGDIGFSRSAINFGASYQRHIIPAVSLGAYAFEQSGNSTGTNMGYSVVLVHQIISVGALAYAHILDPGMNVDVYIAPGLGLHMIKDIADETGKKSDVTAIGPTIKVGVQYRFCPSWKAGLESTTFVNWFTPDKSINSSGSDPLDASTFYSAVVTYDL